MKVKIKDIADVIDGPHATPIETKTGPFYLGIDAISKDGIINLKKSAHLSENDWIKWTKRVNPKENDIVFSYEATLGRYAIIPHGFKGALGRRLAVLRVKSKDVNVHWLYYFLNSPYWKKYIDQKVVYGSTVTRIPVKDYPNYVLDLPPREQQDLVTSILYNIDSKIANNNAISKELESMAKTIYDYWFLQFEFPDKNGKPYKSNGGKMVWNDQLKQEIPEGWEVLPLDKYADVKKGKLLTAKETNLNGKYKVISAGLTYSYHHDQYNRDENTITVSASGANAGFVNLWYEKIYANDCTTVQGVTVGTTDYIFNFLKSAQTYLYQQARGSAQPHVYPKDIANINLAVPPKNIIDKYTLLVGDYNKQISAIVKENQQLKSLRDFLLPLLMNGQVEVTD